MKNPPASILPDFSISHWYYFRGAVPDNFQPTWRNRFELILLGATAVVSAGVSLLDFLGVLDELPWLADRVPTLTLLATGLVAGYLVLERRNQLEKMENKTAQRLTQLESAISEATTTVIDSLNGLELRKFDTNADAVNYVNKRLLQARHQIDDLSWSPALNFGHQLDQIVALDNTYAERVKNIATKIPYREIFIFNRPGRAEKLKRRVEENAPGYSCAYYSETQIPPLQFMVIDKEEVIILSDQFPTRLAIRHPYLVKLFEEYYEEIWKCAVPIKIGKDVDKKVLDNILNLPGEKRPNNAN